MRGRREWPMRRRRPFCPLLLRRPLRRTIPSRRHRRLDVGRGDGGTLDHGSGNLELDVRGTDGQWELRRHDGAPCDHRSRRSLDDDRTACTGDLACSGRPGPCSGRDRGHRRLRVRPGELTVPVGTTVTWINDDQFDHSVVADDGVVRRATRSPTATRSSTPSMAPASSPTSAASIRTCRRRSTSPAERATSTSSIQDVDRFELHADREHVRSSGPPDTRRHIVTILHTTRAHRSTNERSRS